MRDARWTDVEHSFGLAVSFFSKAVEIVQVAEISVAGSKLSPMFIRDMAFMQTMSSGYTSFEAGLLKILGIFSEDEPRGGAWQQQDLVRRMGRQVGQRPPFLSPLLLDAAGQALRFRRVVVHGYDYLDLSTSTYAVEAAGTLAQELLPALRAFIQIVDADDKTTDGSKTAPAPLVAYSQGEIARSEAIRLLGLRDYAGLLVALGKAGLPMPMPPDDEIEKQADIFVELWNRKG